MDFLISGTHINPFYLIGVGFIIGLLGGFFGVGGSFIAGPALFALGVPMNFVVGTDLAHCRKVDRGGEVARHDGLSTRAHRHTVGDLGVESAEAL